MFATKVGPPQTGTKLLVASLAELAAFRAHDQEVIFPGAMRGVTRFTKQAIPVRADLGAGGDEFVRHGPGHLSQRQAQLSRRSLRLILRHRHHFLQQQDLTGIY